MRLIQCDDGLYVREDFRGVMQLVSMRWGGLHVSRMGSPKRKKENSLTSVLADEHAATSQFTDVTVLCRRGSV